MKIRSVNSLLTMVSVGLCLACNGALAKEYLSRKSVGVLVSDDGSTDDSKKIRVQISPSGCLQDFGPMKSKVRNDTLVLMIPVSGIVTVFFKKKLCQSLDLHIDIPKGVRRVTFAGDNCEIWPRDLGAHVYPQEQQNALEIATQQFKSDFNRSDINGVATSVSETHLRLTNDLGYQVEFIPSDQNKKIYYYLRQKDLAIIERIDQ